MNVMRQSDHGFARLVEAVDKPLGFYVLALLIVEGFLTILLIFSDLSMEAKTWGMWAVIGLFVLVVCLVSAFVWFKPTNLTFTGLEALVEMDKISYGTETGEIAKRDLPSGTISPD